MRSWRFTVQRRATARRADRWGWTLRSPNGRIVAASSEGFTDRRGAAQNARLTLLGLRAVLTRTRPA